MQKSLVAQPRPNRSFDNKSKQTTRTERSHRFFAMKRAMGDADKHAIRRKIEEKQVMIREQRKLCRFVHVVAEKLAKEDDFTCERGKRYKENKKIQVRERLSRECADTMFHIASAESALKSITAKHKELLDNKAEDFEYSIAADRREVQHLDEKCAELERIITSSDVVEREQKVLAARLAALRLEDNKEEVANAREMDGLKRNLFNARNDLENVFRTTLHDLNVTYQEQAFDAMVQEATTLDKRIKCQLQGAMTELCMRTEDVLQPLDQCQRAKGELPALRRDLRVKTRLVNHVIVNQSRSLAGAGCAKSERDLTDEFVKLQAKRENKLRRSLKNQREVIEREREDIKDLGEGLEKFQEEAIELRAAAAELRHHEAESVRVREEGLQERTRAHILAKQGPKALKAELRRRRLAALTAATVASFKASHVDSVSIGVKAGWSGDRSDDGGGGDGGGDGGGGGGENGECGSGGKVDRSPIVSPGSQGNLTISGSGSTTHGEGSNVTSYLDGNQGGATAAATLAAERRDTCTLVVGMEVGGLGVDADTTETFMNERLEADIDAGGRDEGRLKRSPHTVRCSSDTSAAGTGTNAPTTAHQPASNVPGRHFHHHGEGGGARQSSEQNDSERIWRASLSTFDGTRNTRNIQNNDDARSNSDSNTKSGGNTRRADTAKVAPGSENVEASWLANNSSASLPAASGGHSQPQPHQSPQRQEGQGTESLDVSRSVTELVADGESTAEPMSPLRADQDSPLPTGLDKLPPEILASMLLLSEHDFVGGRMSASDVLDRARQWEQQQKKHSPRSLQPFPDLPYSFTDLGRRVNVGK